MRGAELHLSHDLLQRASISGSEYAWRVHDIPEVIDAACKANLVSVGGQLQFWLPDGGICEVYSIEVDTSDILARPLSWQEKVVRSASVALARFSQLLSEHDFAAEGVAMFPDHLGAWKNQRRELESFMYFVWYLQHVSQREQDDRRPS